MSSLLSSDKYKRKSYCVLCCNKLSESSSGCDEAFIRNVEHFIWLLEVPYTTARRMLFSSGTFLWNFNFCNQCSKKIEEATGLKSKLKVLLNGLVEDAVKPCNVCKPVGAANVDDMSSQVRMELKQMASDYMRNLKALEVDADHVTRNYMYGHGTSDELPHQHQVTEETAQAQDPSNDCDTQTVTAKPASLENVMTIPVVDSAMEATLDSETTYQCQQCTKVYPEQSLLDLHVKEFHWAVTPEALTWSCSLCDQTLKAASFLQRQKKSKFSDVIYRLPPRELPGGTSSKFSKHRTYYNYSFVKLCAVHRSECRSAANKRRKILKIEATKMYKERLMERQNQLVNATRASQKMLIRLKEAGECYFCDQNYNSAELFDLHLREVHDEEDIDFSFECHKCREIIKRSHYRSLNGSYVYPTGSNCFSQFLQHHMKMCVPENPNKSKRNAGRMPDEHICSKCEAIYPWDKDLISHMLVHYADRLAEKCMLCDFAASNEERISAHLNDKHFITRICNHQMHCRFCKQVYLSPKQEVESGRVPPDEIEFFREFVEDHNTNCAPNVANRCKTFHCKFCLQEFDSPSKLFKHELDQHTRNYPCACDECGKGFPDTTALNFHKNTDHLKPHSCTVCDKRFPHKSYLEIHMKKHTNLLNFICQVCNKAFATKSALNKHLQIHDDTTYPCSFCGKGFRKCRLREHIRTLHEKDAAKQHQQPSCEPVADIEMT